MEAEDRILIAVGKVEKKVVDLTKTTGDFQLVTAVAIAKIEQIEANCPIKDVQDELRDVGKTASEAKRMSVMISTGITTLGAAIMTALGLGKGGS